MKATLQFDLPEDQSEYNTCNQAGGMHSVLWTLQQTLRDKLKYGHDYVTADDALEGIQSTLFELMSDYKVNLEE